MNDADGSELAQLKERQCALELQLKAAVFRLEKLDEDFAQIDELQLTLKSATTQLGELRVRIDQFSGQTKSAAVLDTAEIKLPEVAPVPTPVLLVALWSLLWVFSSSSLACVECNCTYSLFAENPRCRNPSIAGLLSLGSFALAIGAIILGVRSR